MWNYRVGTKINKTLLKQYNEVLAREFFIFECYYNDSGVPNAYFEKVDTDNQPNPLSGWDNLEDLKGTYEMIKPAFKKPIIDLDNFPNIFTEDTND